MDFHEATKRLKECLTDQEIADELGVSLQSIRQARMDQGNPSYRPPPEGWRQALIRLCRNREDELRQLAKQLAEDDEAP